MCSGPVQPSIIPAPYLYKDNQFDTPLAKASYLPPRRAPAETPDADYPLVLCTVREVGHYSCRSMTGNCAALQSSADEPGRVQINPADADERGLPKASWSGYVHAGVK